MSRRARCRRSWPRCLPQSSGALDRLPEVPHGARLSDLERWRRGRRGSGQSVAKYLDQVAAGYVHGLDPAAADPVPDGLIPARAVFMVWFLPAPL
jgi:hypothetical protein